MRQSGRGMAKPLLLVLLCLVVARSLSTNGIGLLPRTIGSNFPAAILRDYAEGAMKLRQQANGNEEMLVVQDSAIEPSLREFTDEVEDASAADKMETSGDSNSGSGGVDGSEESGSGSGDAAAVFREWLAAELDRMTTVIYDCKDRSEKIGDWRNESVGVWLQGHSESYTKDSELLSRVREERFLFGEDDREFVTRPSDFPQCAVARTTTGCTAFFIGPYHALTAAHCVNTFLRGWRRPIRMWLERNCHHRGFLRSCSRVFTVFGHTHLKMFEYDYALIEIDTSGPPAPCWLGIGYITPWDYPSEINLKVLGYPSDKRRYSGQPECSYEAMWQATCNVSYSVKQYLIHWCDVLGGNSGSPIFADVDGNKVAYGIHAHSVGYYVYNEDGERDIEPEWNQGPMITPLRYYQILRWMEHI